MDDNRKVIELINKLQGYRSTGCKIDIQLPQIVVVGAQSSGKSSVLDGLIGASILPRGSGTVTKCPIIVQLFTTPNEDEEGIEFQQDFNDGVGERIKDYDVVRERINTKMNENNGAITDTPIIIRVFSPNVVTLTVVDLPGIKRLTSAGEPSDLEKLIFDLSRKYISEEKAIILAVSPANYDICNSDGLLLAREADPEGRRTIGVLTKLDLMDEGTNARDLLMGKMKGFEIKLGMIGLVNRSQKDIDDNLTVESQLLKEKHFLDNNYPDLASQNGVPFLRKRLHELLVQHINTCLPSILEEMKERLGESERQLESIPDVLGPKEKHVFINRIIYKFENKVRLEIEGCSRRPEYKYLYGGIKIKDAFEKIFPKDMTAAAKRSDASITDDMIFNAFRNSGSYDSFFGQPEAVFRRLAQNQIIHIEGPALKCAQTVYKEIQRIANRNLKDDMELNHFPEMRRTIKNVVTKMIDSKMDNLEACIKDYIHVQSSSVLSLDPWLLKVLEYLRRKLEQQFQGEEIEDGEFENPNWRVKNALQTFKTSDVWNVDSGLRLSTVLKKPGTIEWIKKMVGAYFNHIKNHCMDYVPKLISDRLISQFSSGGSLGEELRIQIFENYDELAKLPPNMQIDRERAQQRKETLKKVIAEVNEIFEDNSFYDEDGHMEADRDEENE